ncbi:hypothetical protein OSB04_004866 [Centaurea solstitialis]|uniref:Small ribosomal subunit protein uS15c n=1 Tax=Centaurea solstitialis TaxID=347529 RepID=A0AA38TQH3_9ASTR|nr:hypothetical protein OSB04_004866 [Centaurea solstitialis]
MMAAAIYRRLRPNSHRRLLSQSPTSFRQLSSSNSDDNHEHRTPPPSVSSYFTEVKASLRQSPPPSSQNRRPPPLPDSNRTDTPLNRKVESLEEIRKNLSEFRRASNKPPPPASSPPPTISFQELYKRNVMPQAEPGSGFTDGSKSAPPSLSSIRLSLRNQATRISSNSSPLQQPEGPPGRRSGYVDGARLGLKPRPSDLSQKVPDSITKDKKEAVSDEMKTEFVRMYGYRDLGEKLRKLRPEVRGSKKSGFSLGELNERLRKVRELDEKENKNRNGLDAYGIRESLYTLQLQDEKKAKPNAAQRLSTLGQIVGTSNFMLSPPKENLVEKYFHPDHMSSSEKQKLELKEVRDKFKMSESDCGSARVQVAQLTTKIKHLATVLHKKDKHSRKGLQAMVQKRKKLLKYLRRTDWDSYCFCLAELGLRDSADYKL